MDNIIEKLEKIEKIETKENIEKLERHYNTLKKVVFNCLIGGWRVKDIASCWGDIGVIALMDVLKEKNIPITKPLEDLFVEKTVPKKSNKFEVIFIVLYVIILIMIIFPILKR